MPLDGCGISFQSKWLKPANLSFLLPRTRLHSVPRALSAGSTTSTLVRGRRRRQPFPPAAMVLPVGLVKGLLLRRSVKEEPSFRVSRRGLISGLRLCGGWTNVPPRLCPVSLPRLLRCTVLLKMFYGVSQVQSGDTNKKNVSL